MPFKRDRCLESSLFVAVGGVLGAVVVKGVVDMSKRFFAK